MLGRSVGRFKCVLALGGVCVCMAARTVAASHASFQRWGQRDGIRALSVCGSQPSCLSYRTWCARESASSLVQILSALAADLLFSKKRDTMARTTFFVSAVLFAIAILSCLSPSQGLYFLVTQGVKRCFLEEVPAHTVVVGIYQNPDVDTDGSVDASGQAVGLLVTVEKENGKVVLHENAGVDGRFAFTSEEEGVFEVCVQVNRTKGWFGEPKKFKFHLDLQVGESSIDYTALAKKEHLSDVEVRVRKLSDRITSLMNELHYQRQRRRDNVFLSENY